MKEETHRQMERKAAGIQTDTEEKTADQFGFEKERNSSLRTPRLLIRTYCKEEHIKRLKFESLHVLG